MPYANEHIPSYAERLGERLRAVRRRRGLTLQGVHKESEGEFKAPVLGAYERGERAISVIGQHRLSQFYNVAIDELLPRQSDSDPGDAQLIEGKPT